MGDTKTGARETSTEIIELHRATGWNWPGRMRLDSQGIHSHCLKLRVTPRMYVENAECLLFSNHRISDLSTELCVQSYHSQMSHVEPPGQVLPKADPPPWCTFCRTLSSPCCPSHLGPMTPETFQAGVPFTATGGTGGSLSLFKTSFALTLCPNSDGNSRFAHSFVFLFRGSRK